MLVNNQLWLVSNGCSFLVILSYCAGQIAIGRILILKLPFSCRLTFKSHENQCLLNQLVDEVKGLNPNYLVQHIRGTPIFIVE